MKAEDLISAGDRAKRHLRVAQALAVLSKARAPDLPQVKDAISRVHGNQPAVAMAIILEYSKRHPLHERGEWLKAAVDALNQYRLSDDADKKEADLAKEHLQDEISAFNAEILRIEKLRERFSLALLMLLVLMMMAGLIYVGYSLSQRSEEAKQASDKTPVENKADAKPAASKTDTGKPTDKKPEPKREPEKTPAVPSKKTEKDGKASKPAGK
jgi:hypothetical protein